MSVLHKHSRRALSSQFKVNFSLHLMMTCHRNVAGVDRTPQEEKEMLEMSSNKRKMKRGKLEKRAKWLSQRVLSWFVAFNLCLSASKRETARFLLLCFKRYQSEHLWSQWRLWQFFTSFCHENLTYEYYHTELYTHNHVCSERILLSAFFSFSFSFSTLHHIWGGFSSCLKSEFHMKIQCKSLNPPIIYVWYARKKEK